MIMLLLVVTGCHSIHSNSVRDLIQLEGTKIDAAQTNIDLFQKETEARIKFLEQARSSLHESFKSLQIAGNQTPLRPGLVPQRDQQERRRRLCRRLLMSLIYHGRCART